MKQIAWAGRALEDLKGFPSEIVQRAGYQLFLLQTGEIPKGAKPMPRIGSGCLELVVNGNGTWFRLLVAPNVDADTIWVLHCFQKKTNQTAAGDIQLAQQRLRQIP